MDCGKIGGELELVEDPAAGSYSNDGEFLMMQFNIVTDW
jgi:hypothetical protein